MLAHGFTSAKELPAWLTGSSFVVHINRNRQDIRPGDSCHQAGWLVHLDDSVNVCRFS